MTLLVAADLLSPTGEIDGALFYPGTAGGDITTRLNAYLTQGYAKATTAGISDTTAADRVARTFAYYRAWNDVVNRITMTPASSTLEGEGSVSFLQSQIEQWILRRDEWKHELDVLLPDDSRTVTSPGSLSILNRYRF